MWFVNYYTVQFKTVDFLDVTFDLDNNVYKPFRKENSKPTYINKHSNHPPSILKQLPKSLEKRISDKDALKESDFSEASNYIAATTSKKQKK